MFIARIAIYCIVVLALLEVFNYDVLIHKSANVHTSLGGSFHTKWHNTYCTKTTLLALCRKEKVCQWN